jgi:cytochrome c2
VHKRKLSFLTGGGWKLTAGMWKIEESLTERRGGTVRKFSLSLAVLAGCVALVAGSALLGQDSGRKSGNNAPGVARGKTIFQQKCTVCHYDTSNQKKIGPGLKGISKRGTFSVNGNKITDETLKMWIENGDQLMPGLKDSLEASQIKDVIAYVKTL